MPKSKSTEGHLERFNIFSKVKDCVAIIGRWRCSLSPTGPTSIKYAKGAAVLVDSCEILSAQSSGGTHDAHCFDAPAAPFIDNLWNPQLPFTEWWIEPNSPAPFIQ